MNDSHSKIHLDGIDGLRGVAILMVVDQHTLATAVGNALTDSFGFRFPYVVVNGWMGVGLFFMLSGFVLALPILVLAILVRIAGAYLPFGDNHTNPVKDFLVARIDDFLVGMILANLYAQQKFPQHRNGMMFVAGWMTIVATAFLWDLRMQGIVPPFVVAFFNNLSQVGFGLILVSVLQSGWPRVLLSIWGLRVLGAMCFSV